MLDVKGLSVRYGKHRALDDAALSVGTSEIVVILGANGAGKSTLLKAVAGLHPPGAGARVALDDRELVGLPPHQIVEAGLALVPEGRGIFADLTVAENLLVAACFGQNKREREVVDTVGEILEQAGLSAKANRVAGALPLLDRKRLEMARALATNPRLLLLDEIAGGLTQGECDELVETIRSIHRSGRTIIWIEHIVNALVAVVSRLVVLNFGRIIAEGEPRTVLASSAVREIYLGAPA